ncbi:hypothetical protein D3C87_1501890 [compost metagenome]
MLRRAQGLGGGGHDGAHTRAVGHGFQLFRQILGADTRQLWKARGGVAFAAGAVTGDTGGSAVGALHADLFAVRRALRMRNRRA